MKKKQVIIPETDLILVSAGLDKNGNKAIKLRGYNMATGFSIQTAGNLPNTGRILRGKKTPKEMQTVSKSDLRIISKDVIKYIKKFGTEKMKRDL